MYYKRNVEKPRIATVAVEGEVLTIRNRSAFLRLFYAVLHCYLWQSLIVPHLSTLSHRRHDFWEKMLKMERVLILYNFCLKNSIFNNLMNFDFS